MWKEKGGQYRLHSAGTGHEDDAIVYDNGVPGTYKGSFDVMWL